LEAARKGRAGFADHLSAEVALEFGASEIITFDKDLEHKQHVRRLK
jgi:predicted nucleic-acid-binding protein